MNTVGIVSIVLGGAALATAVSLAPPPASAPAPTVTAPAPPPVVTTTLAGSTTASTGDDDPTLKAGSATTLQDLVYFGAAWQMLNETGDQTPIVLANGYTNARIDRTSDGKFFGAIVEKVNQQGQITDVVVAYAGAQGADTAQGEALAQGVVLDEPKRAAALFETVWNDPRYAAAKLHVTGHSLGAGYAEYVGAEAVAAHGYDAVAKRVDFTAFGVPNWGTQSAKSFGLDGHVLDHLWTGYTALNDPVITNGGTDRIGVSMFLPPFTGLPFPDEGLNSIAAHWPTTYISSLGLPSWLSQADQQAYTKIINDRFRTKNSYDPNYGPPGTLSLIVQGGANNDVLIGLSGNNMIVGLGGQDTMRGGPGANRFMFINPSDSGTTPQTADRIVDFKTGDRIDFSRMDADTTQTGTQRFTLVQGQTFSAPGQIITWVEGNVTWVAGNVNGDNTVNFLIRLDGRHYLQSSDFVFEPQSTDAKIEQYVGQNQAILYPYLVGNKVIPTVPAI